MRLYSQMTLAELQEEMERLRVLIEELRERGDSSQLAIHQQKFYMAKSYYIGTSEFRIGGTYRVVDHDQPFTIEYFNGVFAWGCFPGSPESLGFPVGMLDLWV
ncbi:YfhH family protein [Brevibacillus ruminantium]|uniref:YfhH family protein n=1 Tax=Brevibacillus ruminantium TaxID=2950604 RepID=A0ABY4WLR8_9BACL|nr:YfhH family protein [Brevibacillus ruminantium]USG68082.1 YfhH family protein [Brevibacillus ruminantium]